MENSFLLSASDSVFPVRALTKLTSREWDVLLEVSKDLTNAEIAGRLHLAVKSVCE